MVAHSLGVCFFTMIVLLVFSQDWADKSSDQ